MRLSSFPFISVVALKREMIERKSEEIQIVFKVSILERLFGDRYQVSNFDQTILCLFFSTKHHLCCYISLFVIMYSSPISSVSLFLNAEL